MRATTTTRAHAAIAILWLVGCGPALATPRGGETTYALAITEPFSAAASAEDIARAPSLPTPTLLGGRGGQVYFARLTVRSGARAEAALYVVPDRGWRRVTLYDGARRAVTGERVPVPARTVPQGHAVLPLTVPPGAEVVVGLRFEGVLDGWEPPRGFLEDVEPASRATLRRQHARLVLGAYAGVLLALAFVNLLFGRILRDPIYFDYVLYAVPFGLIWVARDFIGKEALWQGMPWLDNHLLFAVICASIVFGNRFAMRLLDTRAALPLYHRALLCVNAFVGVVVVLGLLGLWRFVPAMLGLAAVSTSALYIVAGVVVSVRGHRQGPYFVVATGVLAVSTIVYTLWDFDFLPASPLAEHSAQLGSAVEMLLLAMALADRVRHREGERRSAELRLRDGLEREVALRTDELERINDELIELNQQLEALSLTDALTGVANRRRFELALADEWRRAIRERVPLALLIVDVDHFKPFNDAHGHPAGDVCLRRVARVLAEGSRRAGDLLARYGGEEFVVILPNTPEESAAAHADRLRRAIAETVVGQSEAGEALHVTVSIGVAAVDAQPADGTPEARLLTPADDALYRAKNAGRNRVVRASGETLLPEARAERPSIVPT